MDCPTVQPLLSAYHDGELRPEQRAAVAEHVAGCASCAEVLHSFEDFSALSSQWPDPQPPPDLWEALERRLETLPRAKAASVGSRSGRLLMKLGALAALVLTAVATGILAHRPQPETMRNTDGAPLMAVNLDRYLDEFQQDPSESPRVLIARYQGEAADLEEAARRAQFHPVAPDQLPEGFSREATYVLKMECCTGVQTVYKRKGSEVLAILQHATSQPVWYGDRPVLATRVNGRETRIAQVDGKLAATWKVNGTYLSLIGARDLGELSDLMAYLDPNPHGQEN